MSEVEEVEEVGSTGNVDDKNNTAMNTKKSEDEYVNEPETGIGNEIFIDKSPLLPSTLFDEITLAPEVNLAIAEAFQSDDPLDDPNFDTVKHINKLFPSEQSLATLDSVVGKLKVKIRRIDNDIQSSVRGQSRTDESNKTLIDAQTGMADLFSRIQDIRSKAEISEKMVQEITRDIKSLDYAKKHLTTSITTLNHLKMVVGGVDSLQMMTENRQYKDASNVLSAMLNVLEHFEQYKEIGRIKELGNRINDIKEQLTSQITLEFKKAFRKPEPDRRNCDVKQLTEACAVLNVVGADVKEKFVLWFVNLQLRDYRVTFGPNEEAAWLDKIDRRFSWLKRTLVTYQETCDDIFPPEWYMPELIAERFVAITKEELAQIIAIRRQELDVNLLLFGMKKSAEFESYLVKKFPSREYEEIVEQTAPSPSARKSNVQSRYEMYQEERRSKETTDTEVRRRLKPNKFIGKVSNIFESCMDVYVQAQDDHLDAMMEAFLKTFKTEGVGGSSEESEDGGKILDSSGDMFRYFRECMVTCTQLNSKSTLYDVYVVFKKYLRVYCEKMLVANLPKSSALATIILKDGDIKLTPEEQYVTCCILNTAEYCMDTTAQLEGKLKEKVSITKMDAVDLNEEIDSFHEMISNAIQLLVRALETQCDSALVLMSKTKWDQIEEVGDTSAYVSQMGKLVAQMVPFARSSISNTKKYFNNFCMKFAGAFIPRLMSNMYKCKNVGTVGAEQLLLDMQSMRMLLLELPAIGSATARPAPASYNRFVTKGMAKAEMILKIVMAPHDHPQLFVEDYMKLLGDEEGLSALQKILDMKGLKKAEQQPILDAYKKIAPVDADVASAKDLGKSGGSTLEKLAAAGTKGKSILKLQRLMQRLQR